MVNFAAMVREHWVNVLVPLGFVIGVYLDRWNDQKLTTFRNKSALYSRWGFFFFSRQSECKCGMGLRPDSGCISVLNDCNKLVLYTGILRGSNGVIRCMGCFQPNLQCTLSFQGTEAWWGVHLEMKPSSLYLLDLPLALIRLCHSQNCKWVVKHFWCKI